MPGTCATFFTTNECPGVTWITLFGIIIDHAQKEKTKGAWIYFFLSLNVIALYLSL